MVSLYIFVSLVWAELPYFTTELPFPFDLYTENATVTDSASFVCSESLISNGKCDSVNNNQACGYDGGDCCKQPCVDTCVDCAYECGSEGYECLEASGCIDCTHGTCKSMDLCYTDTQAVLDSISNCLREKTSHGDDQTTAYFCGKDPDLTFLHDPQNPLAHFDGCGLEAEECTYMRCCEDVIRSNITAETCDDVPRSSTQFNPDTGKTEEVVMSCLEQFSTCFKLNAVQSFGQCCECEVGWIGSRCDVPTCNPDCTHGTCIGYNECECETGWGGTVCNLPICSNCVNGECSSDDVCICADYWEGDACDIPYSDPPCVNGVVNEPNVCECDEGYTGIDCSIPTCEQSCGNGWCIATNVCECYPPYYTEDFASECQAIKCVDWHGLYCTNCTIDECFTCVNGFYLLDGVCERCNEIEENCVNCSDSVCEECRYPFKLVEGTCVFGGYIEFSSKNYTVTEGNSVVLTLLRVGGTYGDVNMKFITRDDTAFVTSEQEDMNSYNYANGTVAFAAGVDSATISVETYARKDVSQDSVRFFVILYDLQGEGILGYTQDSAEYEYAFNDLGLETYAYAVVEIFDDPLLGHTEYTELSINSFSPANNPITLLTSTEYSLDIQGYSDENLKIEADGSTFLVTVSQIVTAGSSGCHFPTYKFTGDSTVVQRGLADHASEGLHQYLFSLSSRGLYIFDVHLLIPGVQQTVWTDDNAEFDPIQKYVAYTIGELNSVLYTENSLNLVEWQFELIPTETRTANVSVSGMDSTSLWIDGELKCDQAIECVTEELVFTQFSVYSITLQSLVTNSSENLQVQWVTSGIESPLEPLYAAYQLTSSMHAFVVTSLECN